MKYTRFGNYDELILAVKMKNALKKANEKYGYDLEFDIKNIVINGAKRGCSGFVTNKQNGSCVYLNTERTGIGHLGYMYRYADNNKDYKGYHNRWTGNEYWGREPINVLAESIISLLKETPIEAKDCR